MTRRYTKSIDVRASISDDGLVLLDVRGGVLLASNPVGARIWQLLGGTLSWPEIVESLAREFQIASDLADRDALAFVDALESRGLVTGEPSW